MNNQDLSSEDAVAELLTLACEVNKWGDKRYYNKEGHTHRIHGPAIIHKDGAEFWYKNGDFHRVDGPAVIYSDGNEYYYINGIQLTKDEFIQWQKKNGIKPFE